MDIYSNPQKVLQAVKAGHRALSGWMIKRNDHLEHYRGRWAGGAEGGKGVALPLNLMAQAINALLPNLVPKNVSYVVRPKRAGLEGEARILKILLDDLACDLNLSRNVYRRMVAESMVSPCAVSYTGLALGSGELHAAKITGAGEPFVQAIGFGDYAVDPMARSREARGWEAHRIRVDRELLRQLVGGDAELERMVDSLPGNEDYLREDWQDANGAGNGQMSRNVMAMAADAITDTVTLWNVAVYQRGRVWEGLLPSMSSGERWISFGDNEGPEGGPYDHLDYFIDPDAQMGMAPVSFFRDISEAADRSARKLINQIGRSKTAVGYAAGAEKDAEQLRDAVDGSLVRMTDPKNVQVFQMSLVLRDMLPIVQWLLGSWDQASGARLLGGTGLNVDTATGQDILAGQAAGRVSDLQSRVRDVAASHGRKLAFWLQTDPETERTASFRLSSGSLVSIPWAPADRLGSPDDYAFEIVPQATAGMDPNLRIKRLIDAVQTIGSMVPLAQAGLVRLDVVARVLQQELGTDELEQILVDPTNGAMSQAVQQGVAQWEQSAQAATLPRPSGPPRVRRGSYGFGGASRVDESLMSLAPNVTPPSDEGTTRLGLRASGRAG